MMRLKPSEKRAREKRLYRRVREIRCLGRCIQKMVETLRPTGMLALSTALLTLSDADLDLLYGLEDDYGEPRCNLWMVHVLNGTTVFEQSGDEVSPRQTVLP